MRAKGNGVEAQLANSSLQKIFPFKIASTPTPRRLSPTTPFERSSLGTAADLEARNAHPKGARSGKTRESDVAHLRYPLCSLSSPSSSRSSPARRPTSSRALSSSPTCSAAGLARATSPARPPAGTPPLACKNACASPSVPPPLCERYLAGRSRTDTSNFGNTSSNSRASRECRRSTTFSRGQTLSDEVMPSLPTGPSSSCRIHTLLYSSPSRTVTSAPSQNAYGGQARNRKQTSLPCPQSARRKAAIRFAGAQSSVSRQLHRMTSTVSDAGHHPGTLRDGRKSTGFVRQDTTGFVETRSDETRFRHFYKGDGYPSGHGSAGVKLGPGKVPGRACCC